MVGIMIVGPCLRIEDEEFWGTTQKENDEEFSGTERVYE